MLTFLTFMRFSVIQTQAYQLKQSESVMNSLFLDPMKNNCGQIQVVWFGLVWVMLGLSPILLDGRVTDRAHHSLVPRATTCLEDSQVRYIPSF